MNKLPDEISKKIFCFYVHRKMSKIIDIRHVWGVVRILFDEIVKDFKRGNKIEIYNFGTLQLKKTKPRPYHHVRYRKWVMSKGKNILEFLLAEKIRNKICDQIDMDKTFNSNK